MCGDVCVFWVSVSLCVRVRLHLLVYNVCWFILLLPIIAYMHTIFYLWYVFFYVFGYTCASSVQIQYVFCCKYTIGFHTLPNVTSTGYISAVFFGSLTFAKFESKKMMSKELHSIIPLNVLLYIIVVQRPVLIY